MSCCCYVDSDRWQVWEFQIAHTNEPTEYRKGWVDLDTNQRYYYEPIAATVGKCAAIFIGILPYLAVYVAFHAIRAVCTPIATLLSSAYKLCKEPSWKAAGNLIALPCKAFAKEIWGIVRAPFYAVAVQFAALYGIFDPLTGGKLGIGSIERAWHEKPLSDNILWTKEKAGCEAWIRPFVESEYPYTFHLAPCMQPRGKVDAPYVISYKRPGDESFQANPSFRPRTRVALPQGETPQGELSSPQPQSKTA